MEYILWVFNFANFTFRKNYTQKTKNYVVHTLFRPIHKILFLRNNIAYTVCV